MGRPIMERRKWLAVLLILGIALLSMNNACATSTNLSTENVNNSIPVTNNTNAIQKSNNSVINQSNASVKGLWLRAEDINSINTTALKKSGITHVYIKSNDFLLSSYTKTLNGILNRFNNSGIRVNIWIACFKDGNGQWIDPQGKYSYTVKIPYTKKVKVPYSVKEKVFYTKTIKTPYQIEVKVPYKSWYEVNGVWKYKTKYKWTYQTKYKYSYKQTYKWVTKTHYKWVEKTYYNTQTRYGYNTTYRDQLVSKIVNTAKNFNIDGILLDDICYSGVGEGVASKNTNSTEAITSFVQRIFYEVNSIKPNVTLYGTLMPSTESTKYYGQDYRKLSIYLDYMVPKLLKGISNKDSKWIGSMTQFIVNQSKGKPVLGFIQTYKSDKNLTPLNSTELGADLQQTLKNGAQGFILYQYGFISPQIINCTSKNTSDLSTVIQIINAAKTLKTYIETNHRLPAQVQISNKQYTTSQFLKIMVDTISAINSGTPIPAFDINVKTPSNSSGDLINGNLNQSEYLEIIKKVKSYIESYRTAPGSVTSSKGKIQYDSLIHILSKITSFYGENERLPGYISVDSWKISFPPSNSQNYLKETKNSQSTDISIVTLAKTITNGTGSSYDKAVKIFEWVRDNLEYSFYYNTKYGAAKTVITKSGNCVDHSHLLVALARAAGIPARYVHGSCTFNSGNDYGHVWTQLLIDNIWYDADATSSKNKLGVINNWNTKTAIIKGSYIELPF